MAKEQVTVQRSDINLYEYREDDGIFLAPQAHRTYWAATFDGPLSTGERATLSREGKRSEEALLALRSAIEAEGWLIVD